MWSYETLVTQLDEDGVQTCMWCSMKFEIYDGIYNMEFVIYEILNLALYSLSKRM